MSDNEKKVNKNTHDISSRKRVARKFLDVVVVQNNGKEMYKKKCAARAKFFLATLSLPSSSL